MMGRNPIRRYLSRTLVPEEVYRFFEEREGFDEVMRALPPFRPEGTATSREAVTRTKAVLRAAGKRGLGGPVPRGFSPGAVAGDLAAGYDKKIHERARPIAWYLCSYLFSHEDRAAPFVSRDRRETRFADAVRGAAGPILYLPNYNSHFDSVMIAVFLDSLGLGLPFAALGDLLMPNRAVEAHLKALRIVKVKKSLLWSDDHHAAYEGILAEYMRALFAAGAHVVVHSESSRYTTRSVDGTLRATIPPWILSALITSERDVTVVPLSLSLSRVPEDRALTYRRPLAGLIARRDRAVDIPLSDYFRFGRGYFERLASAVLDGMEGVYGRAYLTLGRPFSAAEHVRGAGPGQDPADTIARAAMEGVARNKKILPTHLVAGVLMTGERLTKRGLVAAAKEELDRAVAFHRDRYGGDPDLEDAFSEGIGRAVEEALSTLGPRKIVKKGLVPPRRFYLTDRALGRFYANQLDHRIYPQKAGHNLTVINAGAFGYTLATHLGRKLDTDPRFSDWSLTLFDSRREIVEVISESRAHPHFFPGQILPQVVHVESDLGAGVRRAEFVVIATPSDYFRRAVASLVDAHPDPFALVIATKGFEVETAMLPVEVAWEEMDKRGRSNIRLAVVSGANLAGEIMEGKMTATQIAAENAELTETLINLFSTPDFFVYPSKDLVGTQLAGAMKNVYAIAYGIADGAKDSSVNFTASLVTRISSEIRTLAQAMGADPETFNAVGQAWMADFLATARGGRNSEFGKMLVRRPVYAALRSFKDAKKNVEGYAATRAAMELSRRYRVRLPIVEVLHGILYERGPVDPKRFMRDKEDR